MSIPVEVAALPRTLEQYAAGYLLTSGDSGRVKAVTVEPTWHDGTLHVAGPGRGSLANVAANPAVTLLFPPTEARGFTLLVDGTATASGEDVLVAPDHAVLHRPADHADGPPAPSGVAAGESSTACGHDCHPVPTDA